MGAEIRITLPRAASDVLIYLVDRGPAHHDGLVVEQLTEAGRDLAVRDADIMVADGICVLRMLRFIDASAAGWYATAAGLEAVADARLEAER